MGELITQIHEPTSPSPVDSLERTVPFEDELLSLIGKASVEASQANGLETVRQKVRALLELQAQQRNST